MPNVIRKDVLSPESDLKLWDGSTATFSRDNVSGGTDTLNTFQWVGVDVLNKYGARTDSAITNALSAIGTTNKAYLWLAPGTWTVSVNRDWSAYTNVTFVIPPGAIFAYTTKNMTFPAEIIAGSYQIFNGTGNIEIISHQDINIAWWGVSTSASAANNSAYIQDAVDALTSSGGTVRFDLIPNGTYLINACINVTTSNTRLFFRKGVIFKQTTAATGILCISGQDADNKIDDVEVWYPDLDLDSLHSTGISFTFCSDSFVRDADIANGTAGDDDDAISITSSDDDVVIGYGLNIDVNLKERFLL